MRIRIMRPEDLDFAASCTANEGWLTETRETFETFFAHESRGCFLAHLADKNIGICVATKYQTNGFIGELIVIREMRGKSYGRRLLDFSLAWLHKNGIENIYLDAVPAAVPLYEKAGFKNICQSLRFLGTITGKPHPNVRTLVQEDLKTISALDREVFGDDRSFFLSERFRRQPHLCKVYIKDEKIMGYIMARPGRNLFSVGPWVMTDQVAEPTALLESLAMEIAPGKLRIGVLETNTHALEIIRFFHALNETTPGLRMVLGASDRLGNHPACFAIGSPAKG